MTVDSDAQSERNLYQPVHPDILPKLDPEFAAFWNAHNAYVVPLEQRPWDPACRKDPVLGGSVPPEVGKVEDIKLSNFDIRVFTPEGTPPEEGWPVFIYLHGGGWVLGNINTNNSFSATVCKRASCLVVSVNYRLAPEDPYPAAVEDSVEVLNWVYHGGKARLNANVSKIAVGGSSSGGNLAAVLAHKAVQVQPPIPLIFQLLIVPVVDNTASSSGVPFRSWAENKNTVQLTPARMLWFRDQYLPNHADRAAWQSSPIFAPDESFRKLPRACVMVMGLDILRDEALAYADKMERAGVDTEVMFYENAPHPILSMDVFCGLADVLSTMLCRQWLKPSMQHK
ncbi:hypothetical protein DAEQUDRAFT_746971 [Daedalea quercina L-15889]|uniref:Alpha/beta hydrolase fold-3 domain-containing protein n=1 Tax=Daedalea quercina L-15889 TaxID=1314783 RepID=A0A165ME66_9APHY|nr:hypothetical protein DAEQUDRAFT_746971 [Daedalea quercina L-15889]